MGGREQEAYAFLAERGVNAPAGSFYALEASRRLGLGDTGALRVGLAPYVDDTDVDRLLAALGAFAERRLNSGGRKRSISADHVRWVSSGAWIPPVLRR